MTLDSQGIPVYVHYVNNETASLLRVPAPAPPPFEALPGTEFPLDVSLSLVCAEGRAWHAIHTRSRAEKALLERIEVTDIPFYLPLVRRRSLRRDRAAEVEMPLFPGYVFAALAEGDTGLLLRTRFVANILKVPDEALLLDQLNSLKAVLDQGGVPEICRFLKKGMRVRVMAGPLEGVEGLIEHRSNRGILVLSVDFIQRSVQVKIDETWVEEIG
jgi:transcription antitermination factor NusG